MDELIKKRLKIDDFKNILLYSKPKENNMFDKLNYSIEKPNLVVMFCYSLEEIKKNFDTLIVDENTEIFMLYPKKDNILGHKEITRDEILNYLSVDKKGYINNSNYKLNKMVQVDKNYTLLGFIKKHRIDNKKSEIDKYIEYIPVIEKKLNTNKKALKIFNELAYGYKKDWAKYIFSDKSKVENRIEEMIKILIKGYKTRNMYLENE